METMGDPELFRARLCFSSPKKAEKETPEDRYLSIHDGIWVCTFALNQFGDDLGHWDPNDDLVLR